MSSLLKLRRGSTVSHATFTGADGEVTFNTDTNALVTHDGATAGGFPHVKSADLAASSGASLVGYMPAVGAVATTVQSKLRERVSVKDFGAVGDGTTDDTSAVHAALNFCKTAGRALYFPAGKYRVTAPYTQSVNYANVILAGDGRINELSGTKSSIIWFDNATAASAFMTLAAPNTLICDGLIFMGTAATVDQSIFTFSGALQAHFFSRCYFTSVARPVVYKAGTYFQNAAFRDVQFSNGGTIHSESSALVGTFLLLDNVNHEMGVGPVGAISEKIVCNLKGIRRIAATNFLLEGALPSSGWTVLKLDNAYDSAYTRAPLAVINSFHSEWSGAYPPTYVVDQANGEVKVSQFDGVTITSKYKLGAFARVVIEDTSFSGTSDAPTGMFELADSTCTVDFLNCAMRNPGASSSEPRMIHRGTQIASTASGYQYNFSNEAAQLIWKWDGGIPGSGGEALFANYSGTLSRVSTDPVYGRKLVFTPSGNTVNSLIQIACNGELKAGDQYCLMIRAKLPTYTAGLWAFKSWYPPAEVIYYLDGSNSGQVVDVMLVGSFIGVPANIGIVFSNGTASGVSGELEIYSARIYHGNSIPRRILEKFPKFITTYATAAPITGTWEKGDRVINSAPAVGSPKAWTCTLAGTPGTWVSEGNL